MREIHINVTIYRIIYVFIYSVFQSYAGRDNINHVSRHAEMRRNSAIIYSALDQRLLDSGYFGWAEFSQSSVQTLLEHVKSTNSSQFPTNPGKRHNKQF